MVSKAERLALCTSVPKLIGMIAVSTKFKARLITHASEMLDGEKLDLLIEQYQGRDFIFRLTQLMKRSENKDKVFQAFTKVLRESGHTEAADLLESELIRHSEHEQSEKPRQLPKNIISGISTGKATGSSTKEVNEDLSEESSRGEAVQASDQSTPKVKRHSTQDTSERSRPATSSVLSDEFSAIHRYNERKLASSARPGARLLSQRDANDLREFLKRALPTKMGPFDGDIVLDATYYRSLDTFQESRSLSHPGPLEELDEAAVDFDEDDLLYVPPDRCAQLSQRLGGKPSFCFSKDGGHPVLRSVLTRQVKYCYLHIYLHPGRLIITKTFVSIASTVREIVTRYVTTTSFTVKTKMGSDLQEVNPSVTAEEWYQRSSRPSLHVFLEFEDYPKMGPSAEEHRRQMLQLLQNAKKNFGGVAVPRHYISGLVAFLTNKRQAHPGPLEVLPPRANAYNQSNIAFISAECSIMVGKCFGGKPELQLGKHGGCAGLFDTTDKLRYFGVSLRTTDGTSRDSYQPNIGAYYLSTSVSLEDAIAAAVGWYPRQVWAEKTLVELDLKMVFRDVIAIMAIPGLILHKG